MDTNHFPFQSRLRQTRDYGSLERAASENPGTQLGPPDGADREAWPAKNETYLSNTYDNPSVRTNFWTTYLHLIPLRGVLVCLNDENVETLIWNTLQRRQRRSCIVCSIDMFKALHWQHGRIDCTLKVSFSGSCVSGSNGYYHVLCPFDAHEGSRYPAGLFLFLLQRKMYFKAVLKSCK
jgi:hypothetical protein